MKKILFSSQYIPPEWIKAHGFEPIRCIPGHHGIFEESGEGICPYAELFLRNAEISPYAAVIFTTRCDQMRRIFEFFQSGRPKSFLMNIPATWQSITARKLFIDELHRLSRFMLNLGGHECDIVKLIASFTDKQIKKTAGKTSTGKKIAMMGGPVIESDKELDKLIVTHGGYIALDATEQGEIALPAINPSKLAENPFEELVESCFVKTPDIAKRPNTQFYETVGKYIISRRIDAIIIKTYPWCDLWHAEIPRIKERFRLPVLNYTVDINTPPSKDIRLKTRLKAFFEML